MPLKPRPDISLTPRPDMGPQDGPGATQALQQGALIEGPANLASLLDLVRSRLSPNEQIAQKLGEPPQAASMADRTRQAMTGLLEQSLGRPVQEPTNLPERMAQAAGAGVTESLPFAAIPGGGLGAFGRRAGTELASGAMSEVARSEAEAMGAGPGMQFGASLLAGILPGTVGRGVLTNVGPVVSKTVRSKTARRLAREALGAPIDDRREAIQLLAAEMDAPLFGKASVSQTLVDRFPRIEGVSRRVARSGAGGDDLGRAVTRMRFEQANAAREFAEGSFAGGNPQLAIDRYQDALAAVQRKVKKAYAQVGNLEGIPTTKLKAATAKLMLEAEEEGLEDMLPVAALQRIDKMEDTTSLRRLNGLRSRLLETERKASKADDLQTARLSARLREAVEETEREVAEAGGSRQLLALRRARRIRRIEEERFGETRQVRSAKGRTKVVQDPLNQMLGAEKIDDLDKAFRSFLNRDQQASQVLERTRLTLGDNPEAWGGVQELMRRQVFGPDFDLVFEEAGKAERIRRGVNRAKTNLRKYGAAFEAVYGPGSAKHAEEFLSRAEKLGQGVVGRVDEFYVTGSNIGESRKAIENIAMLGDMARGDRYGWINAAIKGVKLATGALPDSLEDAEILLARAMTDPQLAKAFLEELDPQALAVWQRRANLALGNTARAAAGAVGGTQ